MRALALLCLLVLPAVAQAAAPAPRPLVYVDPGHGGKQDGALGLKGDKEKAVTLQVARLVREALEKKLGAQAVLTRTADVDLDLPERIRRANEARADLFVSVHCNAMPVGPLRARARGVETYFLSTEATGEQAERVAAAENAEARKTKASADPLADILEDLAQTQAHHDASVLAYTLQEKLVAALDVPDRGVHQAPFIVLMGAQMPAVLVEVGYLTHPTESKQLVDKAWQAKIADGLVAGIGAFLAERSRLPTPPVAPADAGVAADSGTSADAAAVR